MQHKIHIRRKITQRKAIVITIASFIVLFGLWLLATTLGWVDTMFLPSPVTVIQKMISSAIAGKLWADIYISVYRIMMGFILAAVLAIPLGILCGCYPPVASALQPVCDFVRYLPVPSLVPLLMVWAGIGETSKILVIFIGTFFQMILMVIDDTDAVSDDLLSAAYTLGAGNFRTIFFVLVPAMAPRLMQTSRMMLGWAWTYLVVAELVAANSGLGFSILKAQRFMQTDVIFMGIFVIGLLGLFTDLIFNLIIKKVFPWAEGGGH